MLLKMPTKDGIWQTLSNENILAQNRYHKLFGNRVIHIFGLV
jgi:hypothetical protein